MGLSFQWLFLQFGPLADCGVGHLAPNENVNEGETGRRYVDLPYVECADSRYRMDLACCVGVTQQFLVVISPTAQMQWMPHFK